MNNAVQREQRSGGNGGPCEECVNLQDVPICSFGNRQNQRTPQSSRRAKTANDELRQSSEVLVRHHRWKRPSESNHRLLARRVCRMQHPAVRRSNRRSKQVNSHLPGSRPPTPVAKDDIDPDSHRPDSDGVGRSAAKRQPSRRAKLR